MPLASHHSMYSLSTYLVQSEEEAALEKSFI